MWKAPRSTGGRLFGLVGFFLVFFINEDFQLPTNTPFKHPSCEGAVLVSSVYNVAIMWSWKWLHVYINSTYMPRPCAWPWTKELEMSDEEWATSLKAQCWTNCDYQLWFPPSICFNLFKCAEAHFIWIKIDEMARNQLSDIVAVLTKVWLCPHSELLLSSPSPLASAWLLYIAVSISALPGG